MRKRTVVLYIGMAALVSIFTFMLKPVYSQDDIVSLQDKAFQDSQRPAAVFVHNQHNEKAKIEECNACHHVYKGGNKIKDESSEGQACSECHKVKEESPARSLMKAYHDLCNGCHKKSNKGPITCGECHRK